MKTTCPSCGAEMPVDRSRSTIVRCAGCQAEISAAAVRCEFSEREIAGWRTASLFLKIAFIVVTVLCLVVTAANMNLGRSDVLDALFALVVMFGGLIGFLSVFLWTAVPDRTARRSILTFLSLAFLSPFALGVILVLLREVLSNRRDGKELLEAASWIAAGVGIFGPLFFLTRFHAAVGWAFGSHALARLTSICLVATLAAATVHVVTVWIAERDPIRFDEFRQEGFRDDFLRMQPVVIPVLVAWYAAIVYLTARTIDRGLAAAGLDPVSRTGDDDRGGDE